MSIIPKTSADVDINKEILNFLSNFEGLHLTAYWDFKQWSIGHGTKSFKGETITKEEAELRTRVRIQEIRDRYKLWDLNIEYQKAIVSYVYNLGSLSSKQQWLLDNNYICAMGNDFTLYVYAGGKKLGGLEKRRYAERNLLCN